MLLLAAAAAAIAATPAENAFLRWADKCPATALGAGLYAGTDHVTVTLGERTLHRLTVRAEAADRLTETTWLAAEDCRAVGYVEAGPKRGGVDPRTAGFVVAKGGAPPDDAERALLLSWVGHATWDATRPEHAVATARLAAEAVAAVPHPEGRLLRVPGYAWRPGEPPAQRGAWRPAETGPDGAACPCWELVRPGEPVRSELAGYARLTYGDPAGRAVSVVVDPVGPRWAVAPAVDVGGSPLAGAPPAALRGLVVAARPGARGLTLVVKDPATGAAALLVTERSGPFAFTPTGVSLGATELDAATVAGWLR